MSKISDAVYNLLDHIGKGTVNQTNVALIISIFGIPFPLYWYALMKSVEKGASTVYFNMDYVNLYYTVAPLMSATYLVLSLVGIALIRKGTNSQWYSILTLQAYTIITFGMCAFFGIFFSPVFIILVISICIGILILEINTLLAGLLTLFLLFVLTTILHYTNTLPAFPVVRSLETLNADIRGWIVSVFSIFILFFTGGFYFILFQLVKSTREKNRQLETIAGKLTRILSPTVFNSIVTDEEFHEEGNLNDDTIDARNRQSGAGENGLEDKSVRFINEFHYKKYNRVVQDDIIQLLLSRSGNVSGRKE